MANYGSKGKQSSEQHGTNSILTLVILQKLVIHVWVPSVTYTKAASAEKYLTNES